MNGPVRYQLEESRDFWDHRVRPALMAELPRALERVAFVDFYGDSGSFGFDDGMSHDDGWGPRTLAVVRDADAGLIEPLQALAGRLTVTADHARNDSAGLAAGARLGLSVTTEAAFFPYGDPPGEPEGWLLVDEGRVFAMTTGAILHNQGGWFASRVARWRRARVPAAVRQRWLAGCLETLSAAIGATDRAFAREDPYGLAWSLGEAIQEVLHCWFLLNRQWTPPPRWRGRAAKTLPDVPDTSEKWLAQAATAANGLQRVAALWKLHDVVRAAVVAGGWAPADAAKLPLRRVAALLLDDPDVAALAALARERDGGGWWPS